ncbi:single-stranded DNA-binding protein [Nocardioides sp. WS12]|uniref:single-stranded DNA-binding protein n=1 Tax=Nocardioides sp. WS12 TaxID=2486272 RepID=UPI0015F93449|nr:single-stranded DNA-binding protein [Nocardioides sp. WS12]
MANETMVTIQGWIGNAPVVRDVGGVPVLNFRVGCTPRHFNKATDTWVDSETQWYGVSAWRRLAAHGAKSLRQGDPVVIHGRLNHRTYVNKNGLEAVAVEIEAFTIGHDLSRGIASFVKAPAQAPAAAPAPASVEPWGAPAAPHVAA